MKKIRNFLLGLDLMLACILAGTAAEKGMGLLVRGRVDGMKNQPVMQINRTFDKVLDESTQDLLP